jgi:hypothetical protein
VLGLIAGSLAAPAGAKKKKKKPPAPVSVAQNYWLRNTSDGCDPTAYQLLTSDGEDATTCGDHAGGIGNEIMLNAFEEPCEPSGLYGCGNLTYTAAEGIPLTLDATQDISGMIAVGSWASESGAGNGAGQATLVIQITGTKDGEPALIGEAEVSYTVTPAQSMYENEFTITPDAALNMAEFTTLELNLLNRGASVEHSWYSLDEPASFITIPQWVVQ